MQCKCDLHLAQQLTSPAINSYRPPCGYCESLVMSNDLANGNASTQFILITISASDHNNNIEARVDL